MWDCKGSKSWNIFSWILQKERQRGVVPWKPDDGSQEAKGAYDPGLLPQKFSWNPVRDYMAAGGPRPKVSQNTFSILLLLAFIGSIIMFNCCGEERDVTKWNHFVWTPFHFLGNFKITSFFAKFNYLAEFDIYSYSNINIPAMDWFE